MQSRVIRDRLLREAEGNVAIRVTESGEAYEVAGRGELQLGVLIETCVAKASSCRSAARASCSATVHRAARSPTRRS